jgi:hypothetical protein
MPQIIDARAEEISKIKSIIPEDPGFIKFLVQLKTLAHLTQSYGQHLGQDRWGIQNKNHDQSDNLNTLLDVSMENKYYPTRYPNFRIFRYVSFTKNGNHYGIPVAAIELNLDALIEVQTVPEFYPESLLFETPTPDPRFHHPAGFNPGWTDKIVKRATDTEVLVRGPITSLGDNVKTFMYNFADKTHHAYFPETNL